MAKRLVVCSDGTWNTADQKNRTNVVKFANAVAPSDSDGVVQAVFYDQGVGSEGGLRERLTGGVFGKGLDKNIEDAYRFLMLNYVEGDEIYLLGFSRGAYTARSTAGMIRNVGLLRKVHAERFPEALKLYRSRGEDPNSVEAKEFRQSYSADVKIHFIGVWDTVGAMGIPGVRRLSFRRKLYKFHNVKLSGTVRNAYHALAIDERRQSFKPTLWETDPEADQSVEQVWFVGVHSDVGGGQPESDLSDIAFEWMMQKAVGCGLAFDTDFVGRTIHPMPLGKLHGNGL